MEEARTRTDKKINMRNKSKGDRRIERLNQEKQGDKMNKRVERRKVTLMEETGKSTERMEMENKGKDKDQRKGIINNDKEGGKRA